MNQYCRYCINCHGDPDFTGEGWCDGNPEHVQRVRKSYRRNSCRYFEFCEIDAFGYERNESDPLQAVYKPHKRRAKDCEGQISLDFGALNTGNQERKSK